MVLLEEKDCQHLSKEFRALQNAARLVLFIGDKDRWYCSEMRHILEDVTGLSDDLSLEMYDLNAHQAIAEQFSIELTPATIILQDSAVPKDYGIRFFGIPSGYKIIPLTQDVLMVGAGESRLSNATKQWIVGLKTPLHLQVFVTPTCRYCSQAVRLAHKLAMESDLNGADFVAVMEFPELAEKYGVTSVPWTVINEDTAVDGTAPEARLLQKLKKTLTVAAM